MKKIVDLVIQCGHCMKWSKYQVKEGDSLFFDGPINGYTTKLKNIKCKYCNWCWFNWRTTENLKTWLTKKGNNEAML